MSRKLLKEETRHCITHNNEPETPERGDPPLHDLTKNNEPETLKKRDPPLHILVLGAARFMKAQL